MKKNQYSLNNNIIAIIELVCTVIAILLFFMPWVKANVLGHEEAYSSPFELMEIAPLLTFIFFAAVIGNIILKFFKRSIWLSVIVAVLIGQQIWLQHEGIEQLNSDWLIKYNAGFSIWGILSILLEVILIGCILIGIVKWLTMFSRKTAKKLLYIAAASAGLSILSFLALLFLSLNSMLVISIDSMLDISIFGFLFFIFFIICGLSGAIIWFMGEKDDKEISSTDVTTSQESLTETVSVEEPLVDSNTNNNRKWYYIGGGVAALAVIIGVFTCLGQRHEFAGKPISELFPEVEKEADAGDIPDEPLTFTWEESQGGDVTIVRKADENQLVVMYSRPSFNANTLHLGNYQNGQYVFYYEILVGSLDYDETMTGISLKNNAPEDTFYYGTFGKDVAKTVEYEWGTETSVDWDKVTEAQLAEIFAAAIAKGPGEPIIITAKSIKVAKEGDNSEEEIEYETITTDLDQFQELIERTRGVVAECERNGEATYSTICDDVRKALESLNENVSLMSDAQRERFNALSQQAQELMENADRISVEVADSVAADIDEDDIM